MWRLLEVLAIAAAADALRLVPTMPRSHAATTRLGRSAHPFAVEKGEPGYKRQKAKAALFKVFGVSRGASADGTAFSALCSDTDCGLRSVCATVSPLTGRHRTLKIEV